jgi:hypothetical protein
MFNAFFPENRAVYEIMWKILVEPDATDENMAHVHFMLDTQGYKHPLTLCNTYCSLHCNNGCLNTPRCNVYSEKKII